MRKKKSYSKEPSVTYWLKPKLHECIRTGNMGNNSDSAIVCYTLHVTHTDMHVLFLCLCCPQAKYVRTLIPKKSGVQAIQGKKALVLNGNCQIFHSCFLLRCRVGILFLAHSQWLNKRTLNLFSICKTYIILIQSNFTNAG